MVFSFNPPKGWTPQLTRNSFFLSFVRFCFNPPKGWTPQLTCGWYGLSGNVDVKFQSPEGDDGTVRGAMCSDFFQFTVGLSLCCRLLK